MNALHLVFATLPFLIPHVAFSATDPQAPRFDAPVSWQLFPDGGVEWQVSLHFPDPAWLLGTRIEFVFDLDLDTQADGTSDTANLSPVDCVNGNGIFVRTSFPGSPAILRVRLLQGATFLDSVSAFIGSPGSLLRLERFCASPAPGEPEWVTVRNPGNRPIFLDKVVLQGHSLGAGSLEPGEALVAGPDTSALPQAFPGLRIRKVDWSYLRNSGDTLRLQTEGVTLDSVAYSAGAPDAREGCAEGSGKADPSAYALSVENPRWQMGSGPLVVTVAAPTSAVYDLIAYDLDGYPLCPLMRGASGPRNFSWDASTCPALSHHLGTVLLQLRPQGGKPIRKLIGVRP